MNKAPRPVGGRRAYPRPGSVPSHGHANESQASGAHKDASPARHTITSPHRTGVFAPVVRPTAVVPGLRSIPTSTDGTDGDEGLGVEFSLSPRRPGSTEAGFSASLSDVSADRKTVLFTPPQSLASVLNNPRTLAQRYEWGSPTQVVPPPARSVREVTLKSFARYMKMVPESTYNRFLEECERVDAEQKLERSFSQDPNVTEPPPQLSEEVAKVPFIFFEENFDLSKRKTFEAACGDATEASAVLAQERLSHWLDLVEVELVRQISARSTSFFQALSRLQYLHDEVSRACRQIEGLRSATAALRDNTRGALVVALATERKRRTDAVLKMCEMCVLVRDAPATVQLLLSNGDFNGALELIHQTQSYLSNELSQVMAFKHMGWQMQEMERVIRRLMAEELVRMTTSKFDDDFLAEWRKRQQTAESLSVEDEATDSAAQTLLTDRLCSAVYGLIRQQQLHAATRKYRERLCTAVKESILGSIEANVKQSTSGGTSTSGDVFLRVKNIDNFVDALEEITELSLVSIAQAVAINECVKQLIRRRFTEESSEDVSEDVREAMTESQAILSALGEITHIQIGKLLKARTQQLTRLGVAEFAHIQSIAANFEEESHLLLGRKSSGIRSVITSQTHAYLEHYHKKRTAMMTMILENEKWVVAEVASEFQDLMSKLSFEEERISGETNSEPAEASASSMLSSENGTSSSSSSNGETSSNARCLMLCGDSYRVVNSCLMLIKTISEYIVLVETIPSLSNDVVHCIVEQLQLFNSRSCQLVLGAGAMTVAKLKSITARHLALAAQCLSLMIRCIPLLKSALSHAFTNKTQTVLLNDFDRIQRDYRDHLSEIYAKFVVIMKERVKFHMKDIQDANVWEKGGETRSSFAVNLVKETLTLHKVLLSILRAPEVQDIFEQVFAMYNASLVEYFSTLRLNNTGKKRLYADIEYLIEKTRQIKGLEESAQLMSVLKDFYSTQFGPAPK